MVICLERGADLHMAQLMPLPLTVSCFSKIQIGVAFLVQAHLGSPGQRAAEWVCVYVCVCVPCAEFTSFWKQCIICLLSLGWLLQQHFSNHHKLFLMPPLTVM